MGPDRADFDGLEKDPARPQTDRPAYQGRFTGRLQGDPLCEQHGNPLEKPAARLPEPRHRLCLLRRMAGRRNLRPPQQRVRRQNQVARHQLRRPEETSSRTINAPCTKIYRLEGRRDRFLRSASAKGRNRHEIGDGFLYSWLPPTPIRGSPLPSLRADSLGKGPRPTRRERWGDRRSSEIAREPGATTG